MRRCLKLDVEAAVGHAKRVAAARLVEGEGEPARGDALYPVELDQLHAAGFETRTVSQPGLANVKSKVPEMMPACRSSRVKVNVPLQ